MRRLKLSGSKKAAEGRRFSNESPGFVALDPPSSTDHPHFMRRALTKFLFVTFVTFCSIVLSVRAAETNQSLPNEIKAGPIWSEAESPDTPPLGRDRKRGFARSCWMEPLNALVA